MTTNKLGSFSANGKIFSSLYGLFAFFENFLSRKIHTVSKETSASIFCVHCLCFFFVDDSYLRDIYPRKKDIQIFDNNLSSKSNQTESRKSIYCHEQYSRILTLDTALLCFGMLIYLFIYWFRGSSVAVAVAVAVVPVYNCQTVAVVMLLFKCSNVNIWNDMIFYFC